MKPVVTLMLITILVAASIGLYSWRQLLTGYKLLVLQLLSAFTVELTGVILTRSGYSNVGMFNVYLQFDLLLLGGCGITFLKRKMIKRGMLSLLCVLSVIHIIKTISDGLYTFNNWSIVAAAIFYIVLFIIVLFDNMLFSAEKIYKQPLFLISISAIIYYSTVIPLFGLLNYLVDTDLSLADRLYTINVTAIILRYTLIAIAFYLYGRQAKRAHVA